ncbi:MAG: T9SS type A sorting domain-containing protein [Flavobacteriales bacterium]
MKKLLLFTTLLVSQFSFCQFSSLKEKPGKNLIHSSIAQSKEASGFYVVASTIKDGSNYDINIAKVDILGTTIWERVIDMREDDRVLDVLVDDNDDIVIAGYSGDQYIKDLYVAKFNSSGLLLADFKLKSESSTVGAKILKSEFTNEYFIGGYTYDTELPFNMMGKALLIAVDGKLKRLKWEAEYKLSDVNNTITDIVELPNKNLFITGSLGQNETGQIILAAIVNPRKNGDIVQNGNMSFGILDEYALGASAVYDTALDRIWLLFNSGEDGRPHFIGIENATVGGASLSGFGFVIEINNTPNDKYAGFKIMLTPHNSKKLTIFGYKDNTALYGSGFGLWALEIGKFTGSIQTGLKIWSPSGPTTGLEHQGGDILSLFSPSLGTGMPYFHTPDIAVPAHTEEKFVAITMDDISGFTEVGLLSFSNNLWFLSSPCFNQIDPTPNLFWTIPKGIFKNNNIHGIETNNAIETIDNPSSQPYCFIQSITVGRRSKVSKKVVDEVIKKSQISVFPNPASKELTISISEQDILKELKLINEIGQVVYMKSFPETKKRVRIDLSDFSRGVYILVSSWGDGSVQKERVVKI